MFGRPLRKFEPLAGVRLRRDLDDEIASEKRAITNIEQAIDNYIPPRCSFCMAPAMDACALCERPICEDDGMEAVNVCFECWDEMP